MAGLAPLARAKLVACRLLHRSPPRRSSSSPLRAGRCAALHLHRDRAPRRLPHAGARRGLNICAGLVAVSPRVRDGPRDNANAPRLPMSPDPTTGVVSPAPCSGQERSSTSGTRCPLPPCGSSSGPLDPRESGRHRTPPTAADHRVSPATAALAASHLRPPGASIPPWCACLRPSMSSGAFRLLTAASTDGSSASGHMPLSAGGSKEFDFSVDGFPEQGRQVSSPTRP